MDIMDLDGVASTTTSAIKTMLGSHNYSREVERKVQLAAAADPPQEKYSNADMAGLFEGEILRAGWDKVRSVVQISPHGTAAKWTLRASGSEGVEKPDEIIVEVFLANGGLREATAAFANHLGTYSLHLDDIFRTPDPHRQRGHFNLETDDGASKSIILWVYGNVFVHIMHTHPALNRNHAQIHGLADGLHRWIAEGAVASKAEATVPKVRQISGPQSPVAVGKTFVVNLSLEGKCHWEVHCQVGNVVFLEHSDTENTFKFYAAKPGNDTIHFCFAHKETLNPASAEFEVMVV